MQCSSEHSPQSEEVDEAWAELVKRTALLGTAAARFQLARDKYIELTKRRNSDSKDST